MKMQKMIYAVYGGAVTDRTCQVVLEVLCWGFLAG